MVHSAFVANDGVMSDVCLQTLTLCSRVPTLFMSTSRRNPSQPKTSLRDPLKGSDEKTGEISSELL